MADDSIYQFLNSVNWDATIDTTWTLADWIFSAYLQIVFWFYHTSPIPEAIALGILSSNITVALIFWVILPVGIFAAAFLLVSRSRAFAPFERLFYWLMARFAPLGGAIIATLITISYFRSFPDIQAFLYHVENNTHNFSIIFNTVILPYLSIMWFIYGIIVIFMGHNVAGTTVGMFVYKTITFPIKIIFGWPLKLLVRQFFRSPDFLSPI